MSLAGILAAIPWPRNMVEFGPLVGSYVAGVAWCFVFERRAAILYTSPDAPLWARGLAHLCSILLCAVVAAMLFPCAFFFTAFGWYVVDIITGRP